jgi:hypothetical protein
MGKPKIIEFAHAAKIYGTSQDIIAEVVTITPTVATTWLKCNHNNRPVRKRHVAFLAREILLGNWQLNGQPIVIGEDEQVLDGQHRLFAIIESGKAVQSLVVYGITPDAFRTIDTGAVRTGADALALHFPEVNSTTISSSSVAVQWCHLLEQQTLSRSTQRGRLSNTDIIEYIKQHPSVMTCSEQLQDLPREGRPMSLGPAVALYEMFGRKNQEKATTFMRRLFTGEELVRSDVEYLLRAAFQRDAERVTKYPMNLRMQMVVKGWNWLRRGNTDATRNTITVSPQDDRKIRIF